MGVREDESEITNESENLPDASARSVASKSYSGEDGEVATAAPGETEIWSMLSCLNHNSNISKNENIYLALNCKVLGQARYTV